MGSRAHVVSGDFDLTLDELRVVTRYVAQHAQDVLPLFEQTVPDDPRPRAAIDAAWEFADGADRTRRQRVTSLDAHRAARSAPSDVARLAARCAGDAASAAYLHPIARATQVGHILRAPASVAHIGELESGGDPAVGDELLERSRRRATPVLIDVLRRFPPAPGGRSRVARLTSALDRSLRRPADPAAGSLPDAGRTVTDLAARVRAATPRCGDTRLVCVDGRSGSGKTTLAGCLAAELVAPVLHLDDLYPGWDGLAAAIPLVLDGIVAPLAAGRAAAYRRWDWIRGAPGGLVELGRPELLVVEGVGSGARVIAGHAVLLVWTEAPDDVRYRRGMARDGEAYRPHWDRWAAQEEAYLAAEDPRARADMVIATA